MGQQGCPIEWTPAGVKVLAEDLGLQPEQLTDGGPRGLVVGTVRKSGFLNRRLVQAEIEGERDMVLVKDNTKYMPGMKVFARRNNAGTGWCEVKRPRSRGRF